MKNIVIYLFLLVYLNSFSQKKEIKIVGNDTLTIEYFGEQMSDENYVKLNLFLQKIENLDTIYIYFRHKKGESIKLSGIQSSDFENTDYIFKFNNGHEFRFMSSKYLNLGFDKEIAEVLIKRKQFLRNNKEIIFTISDFNKNTKLLRYVYDLLRDKPVYLIDCKENKRGKIILRQITVFSDYFAIE